jgi:glutamine cyclotransferase
MLYTKSLFLISYLAICIFISCSDNPAKPISNNIPAASTGAPIINYSVTKYLQHDSTLFTEGFLFYDGQLYESTGSPNELPQTKSMVGTSDLATGKFTKKIEIDKAKYFGEGIVFFDGKLYQLTYQNQIGFIYDAKSLKKTGDFKYANKEGWGLTTDGKDLIMDDGSANLTFLDPVDLKPIKTLQVTENGFPRDSLNELEFIKGFIYANIWYSNSIVKIDPSNGKVVGKIDLSSIVFEAKNKNPNADVLNGIAYDSTTDKIYATGKLWPNVYEISFQH